MANKNNISDGINYHVEKVTDYIYILEHIQQENEKNKVIIEKLKKELEQEKKEKENLTIILESNKKYIEKIIVENQKKSADQHAEILRLREDLEIKKN